MKVRIALDQRDARVLPDMGVKVAFITDASEPASPSAQTMVEVPKTAIRCDGEQDIVFVAKDDKAERRAIKVSATEGETARIESGVNEGEIVIIEGPPDLKNGDRISVLKEKNP